MPIIQPSAIGKKDTYDGTSEDHSRQVPNLESSMDWAEHQRIVGNAHKLLVSAASAHTVFEDLKIAYGINAVVGTSVKIFVSKGIHQPETNPHMQVKTEKTVNSSTRIEGKTYHLDVSAIDCKGMDDRFQWQGVRFSYVDGSTTRVWPLAVTPVMKSPSRVLGRRNSVSAVGLAAHMTTLAERAARVAKLAAQTAFEDLCTAFENLHSIKPVLRTIYLHPKGWGAPKVYIGEPRVPSGKFIKFNYDIAAKTLKLAE